MHCFKIRNLKIGKRCDTFDESLSLLRALQLLKKIEDYANSKSIIAASTIIVENSIVSGTFVG